MIRWVGAMPDDRGRPYVIKKESIPWLLLALVAVLLAVWALLLARGGGRKSPLRIVATTGIIGDAVQAIGGDRVETTILMRPGVDPHLFVASEEDLDLLYAADVVFYNGLNLEAAMGDVLIEVEGRTRAVAVAEAVPEESLLASEEGGNQFDPHVWFDVNLWQFAIERIRETLIDIDPQGEELYRANAEAYLEQLHELDGYAIDQADRVPQERRVLFTAHRAFDYFGRRYGFEARGVQGLSTAGQAEEDDVRLLAELVFERGVPAVFSESSVPRGSIEAVLAAVRSRGIEVPVEGELYSDTLGEAGTLAETYPGMVRHNIDAIVTALMGRDRPPED